MSVRQQLEKLTYEVSEMRGTIDALIIEVRAMKAPASQGGFPKMFIVILGICIAGIFSWLGTITVIIMRGV